MSKIKMSNTDKIKRFEAKFKDCLNSDDDFVNEVKKIKDKGLKELLLIAYYIKIKHELKPYNIQSVKDTLGCGDRKAYDLVKTMLALDTMNIEFQNYLEKIQYEMMKKQSGDK